MDANLKKLAEKLGIATSFCDAGLKRRDYNVSEKVIKFFIRALGYKADTESQIINSLNELENKRWRQALEPIYVRSQHHITMDIVSADLSSISVTATDCSGNKFDLFGTLLQSSG